ncbi:MAG: glycosyl hydrolase 53 family protein [Oscillospiraceae bacterium]|nr:glycosyl hydrolase 53 family protein [Oscillospiraceae bacterium]
MTAYCSAAALLSSCARAKNAEGIVQIKDSTSSLICNAAKSSDSLYVAKIEDLSEDFIMGADISSIIALERSGVKFCGYDGKEEDIFKVLAGSGINCIRVRVWNDPFDSDGHGYGGGNCDINTAVEISKRAKAAGLSVMIDFHYSDFWADPSKQMVPKAWADMELETKIQVLYDFTADCMDKLISTGADIKMVQLGNETNGKMCGEKIWMNIYYLMDAGSRAVREKSPDTLIAVHFTNPESSENMLNYASKLNYYNLDYDVFCSSYYPYWHGSLENLTSVLSQISEKYGKKVMCAETSYAYTMDDGDGSANSIGIGGTYEKPYPFTVQGQSREIVDVIRAVHNVGDSGIGVFYWEPAWLPVPGNTFEERSALWEEYGSGWASSYAAGYDPDDAGKYYGGSSWDNQAMFDFTGHPLESLKTFALVRTGNTVDIVPDAIRDSEVIFKVGENIILPENAVSISNDGSETDVAVEWESADLAAMSAGGENDYIIKGTAGGQSCECRVHIVEANYTLNYSFEDDDRSMWIIDNINDKTTQIDFQQKAMDAVTGDYSLHFWGEQGTDFTVSQTVKDLPAGNYRLSLSIQGGFSASDDSQDIVIFCRVNGEEYTAPAKITSWADWDKPVIENINIPEGAEIVIGAHVNAGLQSWGTLDDFKLNKE